MRTKHRAPGVAVVGFVAPEASVGEDTLKVEKDDRIIVGDQRLRDS